MWSSADHQANGPGIEGQREVTDALKLIQASSRMPTPRQSKSTRRKMTISSSSYSYDRWAVLKTASKTWDYVEEKADAT